MSSLARSADEVGARTGLALALSSVGSLVSSPIQGALLTSSYIWIRPAAFSGCMMFGGAGAFLVARTIQARTRSSNKV
ncbi:hypothetical protein DFH06DRAFT_1220996 [Mycena polygramma]|nr:hypothetical protein DFH06DRAFT_1220996 [Mycena polygramma]